MTLSACGNPPAASYVASVVPETITNAERTELTFGGKLIALTSVSPETGNVVVSSDFKATIVLTETTDPNFAIGQRYGLTEPSFDIRTSELRAWTPKTIAAGNYRLELIDPRGIRAEVGPRVSLTVNDSSVDHVEMSANTIYLDEGDASSLPVTLQATSADGYNALWPGSVEIRAYSTSAYFSSTTLSTARLSDDGGIPTLTGFLNASGQATVYVASSAPENFLLTVLTSGLAGSAQGCGETSGLCDDFFEIVVVPSAFTALQIVFPVETTDDDLLTFVAGEDVAVQIQAIADDGSQVSTSVTFELTDVSGGSVEIGGEPSELRLEDGIWKGTLVYTIASDYNVLFAVGPNNRYGVSDAFRIVASTASQLTFDDFSARDDLTVGEVFSFTVLQTDAYGNPAPIQSDQTLSLTDRSGTLNCSSYSVQENELRFKNCKITKAIEGNTITVIADPVTSISEAFDVFAGAASALKVTVTADALNAEETSANLTTAIAGEPFYVNVWVTDAYGNAVSAIERSVKLSTEPALSSDPAPDPYTLEDGHIETVLVLTTAVESLSITAATLDDDLWSGTSLPLDIVPNIAHHILVSVPTEATVDVAIKATAAVQDQYGNAVYALDNMDTTLIDIVLSSGEAKVDAISTFEQGICSFEIRTTTASESASLTVSAPDATQGNAPVEGTSGTFSIEAGPLSNLEVDGETNILWAHEPFLWTIRAIDVYGNTVRTFDDSVYLATGSLEFALADGSSSSEPDAAWEIGPLVDGQKLLWLTVNNTGESERVWLSASDQPERNESEPISYDMSVFDRTCTSSLAVSLATDGGIAEDPTLCIVDRIMTNGQVATVNLVASLTGTQIVPKLLWMDESGALVQSPTTEFSLSFNAAGRYPAMVGAVDESLCVATDSLWIYVGHEGGSPVGPLVVTGDPASVTAGSSDGTQLSTLRIDAVDCSGDPVVASWTATLQTSVGAIYTATGDEDETTPGYQYKLGGTNDTGVGLSVEDVTQGDYARVVVVYENGAAYGETSVVVTNDRRPPFVIDYSPRGYVIQQVNKIEIRFNEPIRSGSSLENADIEVRSSQSDIVYGIVSRTLSVGGRVLTLEVDPPIELDRYRDDIEVSLPSARYAFSITDDPEGNRLDGNWDGYADPAGDYFLFTFGNFSITEGGYAEATACSLSPSAISPDGQDGSASPQADQTYLSTHLESSDGLHAVGFEIIDQLTWESVAWLWRTRTGSFEEDLIVEWNGRNDQNQVVGNGFYTANVWIVDPWHNWHKSSCFESLLLEVENPIDMR